MSGRAARAGRTALPMLAAAIAMFVLGAATTASAQELEPFEASYAWSWHGAAVAVSRLKLEHQDGDTWVYSSTSEPRGLGYLYPMRPALRSTLRIGAQGVQPLSFKADGGGAERNANVTFTWSAGAARGGTKGERAEYR